MKPSNLVDGLITLAPPEALSVGMLNAYAASLDWSSGVTKNEQAHRVFLRAASLGAPPDEAIIVCRRLVLENGGKLVMRDLRHQCASAYAHVSGQKSFHLDPAQFTRDADGNFERAPNLADSFNRAKLAERASAFPDLVTPSFLRSRSTYWPACWRSFLRGLYPQQNVLVFDNMKSRVPLRIKPPYPPTLRGPNGVWFLSNAVDGRAHVKADGELSYRSMEAVTDFRHLVLECDKQGEGIAEDWLRFLVLLPFAVRAIYTSGGKSIHALIAINANSKQEWDSIVAKYKRPLTECGGDHNAMTAVRLTRLPYSFRESEGRWQELMYYRPDADGRAIADLEVSQ